MQRPTPIPLAIQGGPRAVTASLPAWPQPDAEIGEALAEAVRTGAWGGYHGPATEALTARLAEYVSVPHVYLCSSGTVGVELALRGLGIQPGDEVALAGYDFPGNFRAIEAVGARPVLVDVRAGGFSLDPGQLALAAGPRLRAVIVSHLHGELAPLPALRAWAERSQVKIVEDACQAHGSRLAGRAAGSWGDAGVWSFGGSKLLTAGRGGAVFAPDPQVIQRLRIHCERGNHAYPLSELQATVLVPQLGRLAERHAQRRMAAERLRAHLSGCPGLVPVDPPEAGSDPAYYKFGMRCRPSANRWSRAELLAALEAEGVPVGAGFRGFARRGPARCRQIGDLEHSRQAAEQTLVLHHPLLLASDAVVEQVAAAVWKVASHFEEPR